MGAFRPNHPDETGTTEIGGAYKDALTEPGGWKLHMYIQGEAPRYPHFNTTNKQ